MRIIANTEKVEYFAHWYNINGKNLLGFDIYLFKTNRDEVSLHNI